MSRRKSTVVSPKPATSILRRSARLKIRDSKRKPRIDLVSCTEPPKKACREMLRKLSKRLVYSLDTSIDDSSSKKFSGSNGFPMLRRSPRLSSREFSDANKENPSSTKTASKSSSKKLSSTKSASTSSSKKPSSTKPSTKPASTSSSKKPSSTKPSTKPASTSSSKPSSTKPSTKPASTSSSKKPSSAKPASTSSSRMKSPFTVSSSYTLRRSPRFSSGGGGSVNQSSSRGRKSVNQSSPSNGKRSVNQSSSSNGRKLGISVLSRCSTKSISYKKGKHGDGVKSRDRSRSRLRPKTNKQMFQGCYDEQVGEEEEEGSVCHSEKKRMRIATSDVEGNDVSKASKGKRLEKEVSSCLSENKRMRLAIANEEGNAVSIANEGKRLEKEEDSSCLGEKKGVGCAKPNEEGNVVSKANKGKMIEKEDERLETKQKLENGWTEELELALQRAYLTVKPSPNFWKKVAKMVPGKSAQECFDRVNSSMITPRQAQPRRARKKNLSPIPQFSISASKLLKSNSPKNKIRQRRKHISKKMVRHLLEKQNHMDQGHGFDLFSVLEPNTTSNILSTPMEKGPSLPIILESPMPCTRSSNKEGTTLVSPPVLKQVKNKALHEKYIDHLHIREAKRKAESTRLAGKENIRPIDIQKDMVRAAKDCLFFNVQDAIQKLKGLEYENTPSSSEFCNDLGETDEDESI